jgi:hypothetical protein
MAAKTYYVRTDGNNSNSGTGYTISEAFLTVAKAVSVVAAGDTVRIAPGTYFETMTLATAGTLENPITWHGDKEAQYFLDLKSGAVRITGCNNVTGIGEGTIIVNINSKGYNYFYNFVFDGCATGLNNGVSNCATLTKFYDCIISASRYAVDGVLNSKTFLYKCLLVGGSAGSYRCTCYNCLGSGGGQSTASGGFNNSICYNCTAIGMYGFYFSTCYNCTNFFGYAGFLNCTATNCVAYNNYLGYYGTSLNKYIKCKSISNYFATYGTSLTQLLNINDFTYSNCEYPSRGLGYDIGTPTEAKYEGYTDISKLLKLATALKFDISETGWSSDLHNYTVTGNSTAANDYVGIGTYSGNTLYQSVLKDNLIFRSTGLTANSWVIQATTGTTPDESASNYAYFSALTGTYTNVGTWSGTTVISPFSAITFTENYDILRQPRRMGDGILDCGAFEYSNLSLDWETYYSNPPSIKILQAGYKRITVPVKSGATKVISCRTYFNLSGGTNKPQMIITSPDDILTTNPTIITATGSELNWEELSTYITPKADGLLFIELYNRTTGATSYALFNDFRI